MKSIKCNPLNYIYKFQVSIICYSIRISLSNIQFHTNKIVEENILHRFDRKILNIYGMIGIIFQNYLDYNSSELQIIIKN